MSAVDRQVSGADFAREMLVDIHSCIPVRTVGGTSEV